MGIPWIDVVDFRILGEVSPTIRKNTAKLLLSDFESLLGLPPELPGDFDAAFRAFAEYLNGHPLRPKKERRRHLVGHLNRKFRLNHRPLARLYAAAAKHGVTFNHHQKGRIQRGFDFHEPASLQETLAAKVASPALRSQLAALYEPLDEAATLAHVRGEIEAPSKLRREVGERDIATEIRLAAFASFLFASADEEVVHRYNDPSLQGDDYHLSFWTQLRASHPALYERNRALDVVRVTATDVTAVGSYEGVRASLFGLVADSYAHLNNHGHLAFWVEPFDLPDRRGHWELVSDLMLFAEKHDEVVLRKGYFRHAAIRAATVAHIPGIDEEAACNTTR